MLTGGIGGHGSLQLQGELQAKTAAKTAKSYRGVTHGLGVILRHEGVRGVFRGLNTAYVYQVLLNGSRLGFYEPIRSSLTSLFFSDPKRQSPFVNVAAGASSGIIGAAMGSPFFLVKTRLQSFSPSNPVGTQFRYKGAADGFRQILRTEGGVAGLYRGVWAAMVRTGFGSSAQLPTYFLAKRQLSRIDGVSDGPGLHLACSAAAGFVVCCVMHPPDTIMARLYNQRGNLYSGVLDCLVKIVRTEGPLALYKGYVAHLARILPHTVLTLTLMEQANRMMRKVEDRLLPTWLREIL
ncbi:Mitochondrial oxaloacetate carrier protein [Ascosphaera acerosa]|nr:Mitochondrial oxaloacetate carrier protein [Ascosphaera acerosa]